MINKTKQNKKNMNKSDIEHECTVVRVHKNVIEKCLLTFTTEALHNSIPLSNQIIKTLKNSLPDMKLSETEWNEYVLKNTTPKLLKSNDNTCIALGAMLHIALVPESYNECCKSNEPRAYTIECVM